jgi:hypothetical protein
MKQKLLASILAFFPAVCGANEFDEAVVKISCENDWPDSSQLQEACLMSAQESHDEVMVYYDQTNAMDKIALNLCVARWGNEWLFIKQCFDEQESALADWTYIMQDLERKFPDSPLVEIGKGCLEKWRPDLARQQFCIERMMSAAMEVN